MLFFSLVLFLQTIGGDESVMLFARLVSLISFLCGAFTCVTALRGAEGIKVFNLALLFDAGFAALLFLICMLGVRLGFYTSMFAVGVVTNGALLRTGKKCLIRVFSASFLITAGMYLIFHIILGVITPAGLLI